MEISEKDTYILIRFANTSDWTEFSASNTGDTVAKQYNQNLILSFSEEIVFNDKLLKDLGNFSLALAQIEKSFVVVTDFAKEDIDHELNLIPTENEAIEFIFMEEIERSL